MTLIGVLGLVFQTKPVRPYGDGAWALSDLVGLSIVGLVVGVLNRSVSGLVGTIVGASAAVAIQLFVLTEQASFTPNVVASLGEPAWSRQVPGALAVGIATLIGGYVVGALAGYVPAVVRSRGAAMLPSGAVIRHGVIAGLTLAAAAALVLALVRAAATSAYVPGESQPILRVSVQGDRIAVTPESVAAGRILFDTTRIDAGHEAPYIFLDGPWSPEQEALLEAGYWPLVSPSVLLPPPFRPEVASRPPLGDELAHDARQIDVWPGRYGVVVMSRQQFERGLELPDPALAARIAVLDARTFLVSGPEPGPRAATGGPLTAPGYQFGLAVAGWGTAGSLLVARRGRNRIAAATAGVVAVGFLWLLVGFAIGQSHSPL
jgi:hypothetical protein